MKNIIFIIAAFSCILISCSSSKSTLATAEKEVSSKSDTIRIANDALQYEVIIIDAGFNTWLNTRSYKRNYHTQSFLEGKNRIYVNEWNNRVAQPQRYPPNLYEMSINYDSNINYGYEVNYLIYNYMIYFQNTFKQNLFGYVPVR